jgi:hypothetical protein
MSVDSAVLILASDQDRLAHNAHAELARRGVCVLRVDPTDLTGGADLGWSVLSSSGFVGPPDRRVRLQRLRSVLVRADGRPARDESADDEQEYIDAEIAATMLGLLAGLDCPVINRPAPGEVGRLILRETATVAASGLEPTPTLVTSDPRAALAFYRDRCDRRALLAPTSGCAPPELIAGEEGEASVAACGSRTIVLQAVPEGTGVSVWVVGMRSVCARPISPSVHASCVRAAVGLGLELARFDLVVGPEQTACVELSLVPDLPEDAGARGEFLHALCDLLASASVSA